MKKRITWMTWIATVAMVAAVGPGAMAQDSADARPIDPASINLTDDHMKTLIETVELYVDARPPKDDRLDLYDPDEGEIVQIKIEDILLSDNYVRNLGDGYLLICANFVYDGPLLTEGQMKVMVDGEETLVDVHTYLVGFLVQAETRVANVELGGASGTVQIAGDMQVKNAAILAKNDIPLRTWEKAADGGWAPRLAKPEEALTLSNVLPPKVDNREALASEVAEAAAAGTVGTAIVSAEATSTAAAAADSDAVGQLDRMERMLEDIVERQLRMEYDIGQLLHKQ